MSHTKKPWFKGKSISECKMVPITDTAGNLIALVYNGELDGNLITTAPDLYEVLAEIRSQMPGLWGDYVQGGLITLRLDAGTVEKLTAALARAEHGDGSTKEAAI